MTERLASPSPLTEGRRVALAAGLAGIVFLLAFAIVHHGFYHRDIIVDTGLYQDYGDAVLAGKVPYRDFRLEYPPGALTVFILPALGHAHKTAFHRYNQEFQLVMAACALAALAFMAIALRALGDGTWRLAGALGVAAAAPLLLGSVVLYRFDLWPAMLTVGALAAILAGRERLGSGVLALGAAAKLYPVLLLPPVLYYVWRRSGRREALLCSGVFAAVLAVCFGPFLVLAPGGVWHSVAGQIDRPLQLESLGAALLLAAHHLFGYGLTARTSHGSQSLAGPGADTVAAVTTAIELAGIIGVWIWFARGPADRERLVRAFAAATCVFVAFGKVLSPQFLIWLVALVPLVRGRRGLAASGLLALALVLTQLWFPHHYWALALHFNARASWLVLARDLVLVLLVGALVFASPWRREPARS